MRVRNIKNKDIILKESVNVVDDISFIKNVVSLEIGMGKGNFLRTMAKLNKNKTFIGIEKNASVLSLAVKYTTEEIPNLYYMNIDALNIENVFSNNVDVLYLNFSDPWPKKRHELRRLTSPVFLKKYDLIFKDNAKIVMKTDNQDLFLYSLKSFTEDGYKIEEISLDLHHSDIPNPAQTEYEMKFSGQNMPIYYVRVSKILSK